MKSQLILITLLIKLGVAAAVSSALARSREFKDVLFAERRTFWQRIWLVLLIGTPLMLGVWVRIVVKKDLPADIAFETAILIGIIGGRFSGAMGGAFLSIPAMINGEWLTLPFNVAVGVIAGWLRAWTPKEDVWSFSPFIDLSLYRWITRNLRQPRFDWQIFFLVTVCVLQFFRIELGQRYGHLFFLDPRGEPGWIVLAIYACSVAVVAIPLKIWNAIRIERKLEDQEKLLLQARLLALQRQINPHFLFNTLNSVASLVRSQPEMAREVVVKLANILRTLLHNQESFVPLRDELDSIENYLDIEVVRFGEEKLRVVREIDPETMDIVVPSMILQPLVENSIKHGISPKIEGGTVTLRSMLREGKIVIQIEDDGVGFAQSAVKLNRQALDEIPPGIGGIGMRNVAERLKVLYGEEAHLHIHGGKVEGTIVTLEMPVIQANSEGPVSVASMIYEARASTRP